MPETPLFCHVFASFGQGGVPLRIAGFLNWLGRDARHLIVALDGDFAACAALDDGLDVRTEASVPPGRLWSRLKWIKTFLSAESPDLLLTYNWGAVEWALAGRIWPACPHLHFESGFGKEEAQHQLWRRVIFRRFALAKAAALVVPSTTLATLARERWRLPASQIRLIPNGVDVARFSTQPDPSLIPALQARTELKVIGTVAPLRPEKNLMRLIRAFAIVSVNQPDARLVIVGDGSERQTLEDGVAKLDLQNKVIFTGHIGAPERVLGLFDIFAMSSDTEQMPNAVLQAMAAGLPVVATDVGDIRRMVAEANRNWIVGLDDDALAAALREALSDLRRSQEIGEQNNRRANEIYDISAMYDAYQELVTGLVA